MIEATLFMPTRYPRRRSLHPYARSPVEALMLSEDLGDHHAQSLPCRGARSKRGGPPGPPSVITLACHSELSAHESYRNLRLLRVDEPEDQLRASVAKKAAAFFPKSTRMTSSRFCALSLRISSRSSRLNTPPASLSRAADIHEPNVKLAHTQLPSRSSDRPITLQNKRPPPSP